MTCSGRTYYLDIAFPALKLAIEIDGRAFHGSATAFENDRQRQNDLVCAGWQVLHLTWAMVDTEPDQVIRWIVQAIRRAGRVQR